jgi:hypothetical protein
MPGVRCLGCPIVDIGLPFLRVPESTLPILPDKMVNDTMFSLNGSDLRSLMDGFTINVG